jgi:hypothetical protein
MTRTVMTRAQVFALIVLGLAIGAMGVYVAEADDAPGAGGIGMILMAAAVVLAVQAARNRLPKWAARTAIAVGVMVAALAASLTHGVVVTAPLFPQAGKVPSAGTPAASSQPAGAIERARPLVLSAIAEQNLPGVSVAVGKGGAIVWAEGFGWRDVMTHTPVTPDTRFHIGTAASAIAASVTPLGLSHTTIDAATEWSPEHVGEPEEDFPGFTILRHAILQPIGVAPPEYPLHGDRATFYVPRSDDNPRRGRRLMAMRDLACCANGMALSSTPSDLVRFAMATNAPSIDGDLAGGMVMSLLTGRDTGFVVAVTSNIAHANTSGLARAIADAFAGRNR